MDKIEQIREKVIGMTEEDSIKLISENDINYRIVMRDSKPYIITCDLKMDRLNLEIENNIIIKCGIY